VLIFSWLAFAVMGLPLFIAYDGLFPHRKQLKVGLVDYYRHLFHEKERFILTV
jgi:hypothetical protein